MTGTFIASTSKADMHALAYQGIMVTECFPQIRDMLRRRFGDEYVLLFAEPTQNKAESTVDWYTPVQGKVQRLTDLPDETQQAIRTKLLQMATDIRRFAEELKQSPDSLKLTRGNVLEQALNYPTDDALFVVGEQPVCTCWGFGPGTPGVEAQNLCRLTTAKAPTAAPVQTAKVTASPQPLTAAPTVVPTVTRHGFSLWWLLPLLLFLLLLLLLVSGFGSLQAVSGRTLLSLPALHFPGESDALAQVESQNRELEIQLQGLRERVQTHAAACVPARPATVPASPAVTPPPPPVPRPKPKQDLIIPEHAGNMEFLQGRWLCDTGLANIRTKEPVAFEFSFDAHGNGQGTVHEQNDVCTGKAKAALKEGLLHITLGPQQCRDPKKLYNSLEIVCKNASGRGTQCQGTNKDGTIWDAYFNKTR